MLFEIALWQSMATMISGKVYDLPAMRKVVLDQILMVKIRVGSLYADVVKACIDSDLPTDNAFSQAQKVATEFVQVLDRLQA